MLLINGGGGFPMPCEPLRQIPISGEDLSSPPGWGGVGWGGRPHHPHFFTLEISKFSLTPNQLQKIEKEPKKRSAIASDNITKKSNWHGRGWGVRTRKNMQKNV